MKRLSDLDDDFMDLNEESDDEYEYMDDGGEVYENDYEYEDDYEDRRRTRNVRRRSLEGHKAGRIVPVIAGVMVLLLAITIVMMAVVTRKKTETTVSTDTVITKQQDEGVEDTGEPGAEDMNSGDEPEDGSIEEQRPDSPQEEQDTLENAENGEKEDGAEAESKDPQTDSMSTEQGTEVDVSALLSSGNAAETDQVTIGIDVARYQGTIDWTQVASSGIDFVMVRVGYRADATREICEDTNARYNMQEAQKNGIKVGAYFFSTAVTAEEAIAEADWVADYIAQYQITYPVAYDCEGFDRPDSAQYNLTNGQRTDIAIAFLQQIYSRGYTPMFYASMGELSGNAKWDTTRIEGTYRIWVSQYPAAPYPQTAKSSYGGTHAMWQYTNRGTVPGIARPVDVNVAYFGYEGTADALDSEAPEEAHADVEALMSFTEVNETVTAKESTNLRNIPSQGEDSSVVYTLKNGESVTRTGVSSSGWSRLNYEGQTVYAVSSYLTTDLNYQAPAQEGAGSGDGLKTRFTDCNEQMTAKIEVNLRTLPSVTNPDASVAAVLHNGEYVTRTGINEAYGWSRVEYNGQTLYCISSYLMN